MTAPEVAIATRPLASPSATARAAVLAAGCGLLAARPALIAGTPHPAVVVSLLFGDAARVRRGGERPAGGARRPWAPRSAHWPSVVRRLPLPACWRADTRRRASTIAALAANTLAAVAEEVWFRRFCFDAVADAGVAYAVVASAVLFALVHVASYELWVLPIDLAAGVVLGWQRAYTGSWKVPAATHAFANLLVLW